MGNFISAPVVVPVLDIYLVIYWCKKYNIIRLELLHEREIIDCLVVTFLVITYNIYKYYTNIHEDK